MVRISVLATATVMLLACAPRTSMTSFVDPAYRQAPSFSSVAVFAPDAGLDERVTIETAAADAFTSHQVRAVRGIDLIPPTRQITKEEWANQVIGSGVDTVLFIAKGGQGTSQAYVPQTYYPGATTGTAQTLGNRTVYNFHQSPGFTTGGFMVSKPHAAYSAILINLQDGQQIWAADATSRSNAFASFDDLDQSVAKEAVAQLIADRLF
jgi:hypothetical protein